MRSTRRSTQDTRVRRSLRPAAGLATALTLVFGMTGFAALPAAEAGDDVEVHDTAAEVAQEEAAGVELDLEDVSVGAEAAPPADPAGTTDPADSDSTVEDEDPGATDTTAADDDPADPSGTDVGDPGTTEDAAAGAESAVSQTDGTEEPADSGRTQEVELGEASSVAQPASATASGPVVQSVDVSASNPYVHVTDPVAEWDMARTGMALFAGGFAGDSAVVALVDGESVAEFRADAGGFVDDRLVVELAPGSYTLVLTADEGATSPRTFTVVADDDYYDPVSPQVWASASAVTVSELEEAPVAIRGTGYPINAPVDLLINGTRQEALTSDSGGTVELELMAPLAPGAYTVALRHPAGSASATFHVVPDEQGDPAPAGAYAGQSVQDRAGSRPWDEGSARRVQFRIDTDGRLTGFQTEFWWVCAVGGLQGSGYDTFDGMPATQITVGRPFEISWADTSMTYTLTGVVNADGTAAGRGVAHQGVCGAHEFAWTAQLDGDLPGPADPPPPAQIPADTPDADDLTDATRGQVTVPATVTPGATFRVEVGIALAGDRVGVWLFSEPTHLVTAAVSTDGTVQVTLPATAVGEHRIAVYAADGSLIGWDTITLAAAVGDPDDSGTPGDGSDGSGDDGGPVAGADDVERSGDSASRAAGGAERDGAAGASVDRLPETGVTLGPVALIALTALLAGVALVRRSRARA